MWYGILGGTIIGANFFDQPPNGLMFPGFLVNESQLLEDMILKICFCNKTVGQHISRKHLDLRYYPRWIDQSTENSSSVRHERVR